MSMMTTDQYRKALVRVGLSQARSAHFFGVSKRTAERWAADEAPDTAAKFLLLMQRLKLSAAEVDQILAGKLTVSLKKEEK